MGQCHVSSEPLFGVVGVEGAWFVESFGVDEGDEDVEGRGVVVELDAAGLRFYPVEVEYAGEVGGVVGEYVARYFILLFGFSDDYLEEGTAEGTVDGC